MHNTFWFTFSWKWECRQYHFVHIFYRLVHVCTRASSLFLWVWIQVLIDLSSKLCGGFQNETGDSDVEYVRTDGFHIILKQHSPPLELHETMNKGGIVCCSRLMQIECKPWVKYVD